MSAIARQTVQTPQTQGWAQCMDYFARNEAVFQSELGDCALQADAYYPPSLYDNGHYETYQSFGRYGFGHSEHVFVPGDYSHNAQVNALRARIIEPCMQSKGWNTARGWEYGKRNAPLPPQRKR